MKTYKIQKSIREKLLLAILLCMTCNSCKKLVEVPPPVTAVTSNSVFDSDATAIGTLTAFYFDLANIESIYNSSSYLGFYSDEFTILNPQSTPFPQYYDNSLSSSGAGTEFWNAYYPIIYRLNGSINGLNTSNKLTPTVKKQLMGEALFLRAFFYFQLTSLYGDVPLILTTDNKLNQNAKRKPENNIFTQIINDLLEAQKLLTKNFTDGTLITLSNERLRPTYWSATALLARVYLYNQDWANAEAQSTILIQNNSTFGLSNLGEAFLRAGTGNLEAIWQLQPVGGIQTPVPDASQFVLTSASNPTNAVTLSDHLLKAFEKGDQRQSRWVDSISLGSMTYYFPNKYKVITPTNVDEYLTVFRLAEQYLIRAEARAQLREANAIADLNKIRGRAGLNDYSGQTDEISLLNSIYHERQVELFSEQGHRWFDLKRTKQYKIVMPTVCLQKGVIWSDDKVLFPVPYSDIQADPNLTQNSGY